MNDEVTKLINVSANERMILDIVRRSSGMARSAIAGKTNLTQQSVHRILDKLLEFGYLQLGDPVIQGRGQPSPSVLLNCDAFFSIGVSLNTDEMLVNLVNFCGDVLAQESIPFAPTNRLETQQWLKALIDKWKQQFLKVQDRIVGIGFAMTGYFVKEKGWIQPPVPLLDWAKIDLQSELEHLLSLPIVLINNATTGAIGESFHGAGLRYKNFGYLSFNFGFGSGIVIDGEPFFGAFGNAGEIGRIYTNEETPFRPALGLLLKSLANHGVNVTSVSQLKKSFDPEWPGVAEWVKQATPHLLRAINSIRGVIDPDAIVMGGQIPKQLAELLIASLNNSGLKSDSDLSVWPDVFISELDDNPAALGAALLPLRNTFFCK